MKNFDWVEPKSLDCLVDHYVPQGEIYLHDVESGECPCKPQVSRRQDYTTYVHNSLATDYGIVGRWKLMIDAPRDGRMIFVWTPQMPRTFALAHFAHGRWEYQLGGYEPTHFFELIQPNDSVVEMIQNEHIQPTIRMHEEFAEKYRMLADESDDKARKFREGWALVDGVMVPPTRRIR